MSELKFIETTDETIYTDILEELENGVGEPLYPGDERRIFGDTMAKVIVTVYNTVNDACRQKMLRYARGTVLDALGENRDVIRLDPTYATTLLRSNNMDNLQLRQRIVRSMIRVSERTANMRKPEKFEYRKHMTAAFMDMLELCIEANRARGSRRVELQNKMDTKLDVLRSLVDTAVSPEDRLISPGLHEIWSKELNEIGRMLGGWKKSNE